MQGNEFAGCYNENSLASANFSIKSVTGGHGVQSASFLLRTESRERGTLHNLCSHGRVSGKAKFSPYSFSKPLPLSLDPSTSLHVPSIPDFISPLHSFLFPAKLLFSCTGPSNHSLCETSPTKRSPVCKDKLVSGCQQSFSTSLFPHPHLLLFGVRWLSLSLLKLMVSDVVSGQWRDDPWG